MSRYRDPVSQQPISAYALLSDRHSAALVGQGGSVDWLCFPRFDSPSIFGSLLDPAAGHWSIRPRVNWTSHRAYIDRTMVLTTTYRTATGAVEVTDALAADGTDDPHRLGEAAPHLLIRSITGVEGEVAMRAEWCPRPEYGLVTPLLSAQSDGAMARGGPAWLALSSPIGLTVASDRADLEFTVSVGQQLLFGLQWAPLTDAPARFRSQAELADQLERTVAAWTDWSIAHRSYTGVYAEQVWMSGRVLQALTYQPTGAIVAAATTSLPETIGGVRNWDYRYAWIRDAAFSMDALRIAACLDEAGAFFDFMTTAAASRLGHAPLQVMYGVAGERELYERELTHLAGWRGSVPVRIGNGAFDQDQLDVYGELLETAAHFRDQLADADETVKAFLRMIADTAAERWNQPDRGIWEVRGEPRHFLYSKLMCWVALDRAVDMADLLDAADQVGTWTTERDRIAAAILDQGWNKEAGAFTQSFGSTALDATALTIPILGFLPGADPRVNATIDAVRDQLSDPTGLVWRYRTDDGLEGEEGTFLICTFWLAHALALADRLEEAEAVFARVSDCVNDVGLLAEEFDGITGEMLGNFPQAFSHIGLINAAAAIEQSRQRLANRG